MNVEVFLLCMGAANSGAYCVKHDKIGPVVKVQKNLEKFQSVAMPSFLCR